MTMATKKPIRWESGAFLLLLIPTIVANPASKPFIAFHTSHHDQDLHHNITWDTSIEKSAVRMYDRLNPNQCPMSFSLGISKRLHHADGAAYAIRQPPVIHPVFPARGPGRQVVYNTQFEHLDLLSPAKLETPGKAIKEALVQGAEYPLLLESSSFLTSPILHDINGDGFVDAILSDYDGGIYVLGLAGTPRYFHKTQVPRLFVRRDWVQSRINDLIGKPHADEEADKDKPHDPYHSYFEYYYSTDNQGDNVLRAVTANVFGQDHDQAQALKKRRSRRIKHDRSERASADGSEGPGEGGDALKDDEAFHRRLQEVAVEHEKNTEQHVFDENDVHENKADRVDHVVGHTEDSEHARVQDGHEEQGLGWNEEKRQGVQSDQAGEHMGMESNTEDGKMPEVRQEQLSPESGEAERMADQSNVKVNEDEHAQAEHGPDFTNERVNVKTVETGRQAIGDEPKLEPFEAGGGERDSKLSSEQFDPEAHDPAVDVDLMNMVDDFVRGEMVDDTMQYMDDPEPPKPIMDDYTAADYTDDPDYGTIQDDGYRGYDYDDMYGGYNEEHSEYYDTKNYIRIPPHILSTPVLAEIPKLYGNTNEMDDILFVAVSYYFDEDEYDGFFSYKRFDESDHGDETEVQRGTFLGSAIMAYVLGDSARWSGQNHLDLSTDWSAPENVTFFETLPVDPSIDHVGAFALSSPTVADLDGDGNYEVLIGTSMGIIYCFDARQMFKRDNWPIQLPHAIESRILVEDVVGDTNLEILVTDTAGNVVCFTHGGERLWNRNLPLSFGHEGLITGSSPLTLGDVNGDGKLDVVIVLHFNHKSVIYAVDAATGLDLPMFPIMLDPESLKESSIPSELHQQLPQPLLVDLHADQHFLEEYLRRNGTKWTPAASAPKSVPVGGEAPGLHIVQPLGQHLYVIEGASGCSHKVSIGDEVATMVQVDDVHGNNRLDLVIATESGNVVTFEASAPYHPLNIWNHGDLRGRMNGNTHGYSAPQGIFIHEQSRQYVDIFGVYVPVTFEIFDNRGNIANEPNRRKYAVDIRDGTSWKRILWRGEYTSPGVYTERVYVRYGPGYYSLSVVLRTSHGMVYEDSFSVGYNVHFLQGFGVLLWLPLLFASVAILLCGAKKQNWDDDDYDGGRDGDNQGILGRSLPS
jgi:hypothetical protein